MKENKVFQAVKATKNRIVSGIEEKIKESKKKSEMKKLNKEEEKVQRDTQDKPEKATKMVSNEAIYKVVQWLPIAVSAVFFIINVMKKNIPAMVVIGLCLVVFLGLAYIIKIKNVSLYKKSFVMSMALPTLVFMISLFSGASYSDDFPLMLAVIALTGMFLEPKITFTQNILADVYFIIMYIVHPEKSGGLGQYILCFACFALAAALFSGVIRRGRAFIEMTEQKAKETEALLASIQEMGDELQYDFDLSSGKIKTRTIGLQQESESIAKSAGLVSDNCSGAMEKLTATKLQIQKLDEGVQQFEAVLVENRNKVETMNEQVAAVGQVIADSGAVFQNLEEQMHEIAGVAKQISDIAFRLTILSLNASVESAHAGRYGAGFEVVASEIRSLSESSAGFSERVSDVVKELLAKVDDTSKRVGASMEAVTQSQAMMDGLVDSFNTLNEKFAELYENIEGQSWNVTQIDQVFVELGNNVSDMHNSSLTNQRAVAGIAEAMMEFSGNVGKIVENTRISTIDN